MDGIRLEVSRLHRGRVERVGNWGNSQTLGHHRLWSTNASPSAAGGDDNEPLVPLCAWDVCNPGHLISVLMYEDLTANCQ